jgi:hypothetical protein
MNLDRSLRWVAVATFALIVFSAHSNLVAQPERSEAVRTAARVVPPPKAFATSDEHYKFLLARAKGGTKHTITSVPRWDGCG